MIYNKIPRVLHVFTLLDKGGAETMIMNYYRHIDRTKVQFDFLVHRPQRGAYEDEIERLGGRVFRIRAINPLFPKLYYKELNSFFQKNKDYKIIHSHLNTFSSFPLKIAKQNNIPFRISHAHIALEPITIQKIFKTGKIKSEIKNTIKYLLRRRCSKYSTHLMSCGTKAGIWMFNNNKFVTVNNAIKTSDFLYNEITRAKYIEKFNLQGSIILGHIGRFNEQKNHVFLLEIMKSIVSKNSRCKLLLIGNGELKFTIESKVKELNLVENILFLGVRSDIAELLQMMDVFVFPSLYEGLPVTLIEAQAAGLKVFASDSITQEVALTDEIDFLSLDNTPEYWADKILASLSYKRKNNFEIIESKGYDINENALKLQNFYLKQIGNHNN